MTVVTTLSAIADIATQVGGADVRAYFLLSPKQDPHFVQPRPILGQSLDRADLLIRLGLGMEDGWLLPLLTAGKNDWIREGNDGDLVLATYVKVLEAPDKPPGFLNGDLHPGGNPHFLLDPRNAIAVAQAIAERMAKLLPARAAVFRGNAEAYAALLSRHIARWEKEFGSLRGMPFIGYHRSWSYLAAWLGMVEVGTIEAQPGLPPSPEEWVKLASLAREKKVKRVLVESHYPTESAMRLARGSNAAVVKISADGSYVDFMQRVLRQIKKPPVPKAAPKPKKKKPRKESKPVKSKDGQNDGPKDVPAEGVPVVAPGPAGVPAESGAVSAPSELAPESAPLDLAPGAAPSGTDTGPALVAPSGEGEVLPPVSGPSGEFAPASETAPGSDAGFSPEAPADSDAAFPAGIEAPAAVEGPGGAEIPAGTETQAVPGDPLIPDPNSTPVPGQNSEVDAGLESSPTFPDDGSAPSVVPSTDGEPEAEGAVDPSFVPEANP